jgi:hypothetical protein
LVWRNWGEKKKQAIDAKPKVCSLHMPPRHVGATDEIPTPPRKLVFCNRMTPHALPKMGEHYPRVDVCNTRVDNFFLVIFIFIKISNCPSIHLITTIKKPWWKYEKPPKDSLVKLTFKSTSFYYFENKNEKTKRPMFTNLFNFLKR